jgi:hypothetical protein
MKRLLLILLLSFSLTAQAVDNAIKMGYNFTTVSQTVVFNDTMRAGGALTFSANAMDGGGRAPGDPFTMKLVFYNSSNQIITTVQQAYTLTYGVNTPTPYSMSTSNCGGSCTNVAYVSAQFYGKDGGYWAGNYGPYITTPSLTFLGGSNILYNPEFGVYGTNGFAQGWTSSAGWQNCALYSGAATCVINNGAPVNASGGGYSSTGGTTSSPAGGQTTTPSLCCGGSSTSFNASPANVAKAQAFVNRTSADSQVYIEQIGNDNEITINQSGTNDNKVDYYSNGSYNTVNITQSGNNSTQVNYVDLTVGGNSNTVNLTQQSTAGAKGIYATVNNNNNNVTVLQKDSGNQYLNLDLSGGNKTVDITQQGSANHMADITLSGAGARSLNLNQQGTTQQFYSINSTCASSCQAITVIQGQ